MPVGWENIGIDLCFCVVHWILLWLGQNSDDYCTKMNVGTVFLSEHDPIIALQLCSQLEDMGYFVLELDALLNENSVVSWQSPCFVISNWSLSFQDTLINSILEKNPDVKIMYLTALRVQDLRLVPKDRKILFKPFTRRQFMTCMQNL